MNRLSNSPYTPDLRGFIAYLEAEHPEQVIRVSKQVDPKFGVSGILERLERDGRFPLVIFDNVKGSKIPLVANMHASFERLRLGLGMERGGVKEFVAECAARHANPIDPVKVETGPVRDVLLHRLTSAQSTHPRRQLPSPGAGWALTDHLTESADRFAD